MKAENLSRMLDWLMWALVFHLGAITLRTLGLEPQIQTVLWKLGNLTLAAYAGYWIDRRTFRMRIDSATPALEQMRRAIIIAAAMIAVGLGL
jgi:hypothetical protein